MEETRKSAVELSDEEMDQISGGKAAIITTESSTKQARVQLCNLNNQAGSWFLNCLNQNKVCGSFHLIEGRTGQSCSVCQYYQTITISLSSVSSSEISDYYKGLGYSVLSRGLN